MTGPGSGAGQLRGCAQPLATAYDVALLDLDGVVYLVGEPIRTAPPAIAAARAAGLRIAYVTNNASRTPQATAELLRSLGVDATPDDVVTSAQAAGHLLTERLPAGAPVLVVGGPGLHQAVVEAGLAVVASADDAPAAVVQGYAAEVSYAQLAEAALAVRAGALWVATNTDATMPSRRGLLPGNGTLVGVVRSVVDRDPLVAGKPQLPLHQEAVRRTGARRPLVVGDRLDTDIEGAVAAGTDSLLVLTGVTDPGAVLTAPPHARPTYLSADLSGLGRTHPEVTVAGPGRSRCGRFTAVMAGSAGELELTVSPGGSAGSGDGAQDGLDALRAAAAACWSVRCGDRLPAIRIRRGDRAEQVDAAALLSLC